MIDNTDPIFIMQGYPKKDKESDNKYIQFKVNKKFFGEPGDILTDEAFESLKKQMLELKILRDTNGKKIGEIIRIEGNTAYGKLD
jgi:hypothetical protein